MKETMGQLLKYFDIVKPGKSRKKCTLCYIWTGSIESYHWMRVGSENKVLVRKQQRMSRRSCWCIKRKKFRAATMLNFTQAFGKNWTEFFLMAYFVLLKQQVSMSHSMDASLVVFFSLLNNYKIFKLLWFYKDYHRWAHYGLCSRL